MGLHKIQTSLNFEIKKYHLKNIRNSFFVVILKILQFQ